MSFGSSDLHLRAGSSPVIRVNGELKPLSGAAKLNQDETLEMAFSMMSNRQKQHFKEVYEVDIGYGVSGLGRFRVNIFQQRNSIGIVARVISDEIRNFAQLGLPPVLTSIADENRGLILVTGTTGSGKSTTLAAVVDHINEQRNCHIVTIEDPIEFMHEHKLSTVHQRELHSDTPDFALALRAALRQAPKVILVGEMRDRETIEVALEAAETGHLVLSTLHTIDAAKTIDRIIGVFPKNEEAAIRTRLAQSFRRIISQRLMPKVGGGRKAAIEILVANSRTKEYIEKGEREGRSMIDAMRDGAIDGMQTFDGELEKFIRDGSVARETALAYSTNANNLALSISDLDGIAPPQNDEIIFEVEAEPALPASDPSQIEGFER
jgi:twitching motility protein PilT